MNPTLLSPGRYRSRFCISRPTTSWQTLLELFGGYDHETMVLGAIERGGNVRLQVGGKKPTRGILHSFIKSKLAEETSLIITDEWGGYQGVADKDTLHAYSQSLST